MLVLLLSRWLGLEQLVVLGATYPAQIGFRLYLSTSETDASRPNRLWLGALCFCSSIACRLRADAVVE